MNISTETTLVADDCNYGIDDILSIETESETHTGRLCDIGEDCICLDMSEEYQSNVIEILFADIVDIIAR